MRKRFKRCRTAEDELIRKEEAEARRKKAKREGPPRPTSSPTFMRFFEERTKEQDESRRRAEELFSKETKVGDSYRDLLGDILEEDTDPRKKSKQKGLRKTPGNRQPSQKKRAIERRSEQDDARERKSA